MMQLESDLRLNDLIVALKSDHKEIRRQLWILRMLVLRGDYDLAEKRTLELKTFVDSHFAKEESRVRDVVAACASFSSANDAATVAFDKEDLIDSMIREHKIMSDSFKEIQGLTRFSSEVEKHSCFDTFERALLNCLDQEDKEVLPFLIETINEHRRRSAHRPRFSRILIAS